MKVIPIACLVCCAALPALGQSGAKNGEWTTYGGDSGNTRYAPLDQITPDNFSKLQVAWRFKTENLGPASGIQSGGHAAHGEGHPLFDRGNAPRCGRNRRRHR